MVKVRNASIYLCKVTNPSQTFTGYPVSVGNMITLPVSASMYQTMMANIQQIQPNGDGTVCITPMQVDSNDAHSSNNLSVNSSNDSSSCSSSLNYIQASSPSPSTHHHLHQQQQHHHHHNHHHQQQHSHPKTSVTTSTTTTTILPSGKLVRAIFQDNIPNRSNLNNSSDLASQTLINHSSNHTTSNNSNHNSSQRLSQQEHEMFGNTTTTTFIISTTPSPPHEQQHHHHHNPPPPLPPPTSSSSATLCSSSPTSSLTTVINRANNPCQKQVQVLKKRKQSFTEILLDQEQMKKRSKVIELDEDEGVEERDVTVKVELSPSKVKMEIQDEMGAN